MLRRAILPLVAVALLAAGPAVAQEEADDLSSESSWFQLREGEQTVGYMEVSQEESDDDEAPIRVVQELHLRQGPRNMTMTMSVDCADDSRYSAKSLTAEMAGAGPEMTMEGEVSDGEITVTNSMMPEPQSTEVDGPVTTALCLFEVVQERPFDEEDALDVTIWAAPQPQTHSGTLSYEGTEETELPDGSSSLHHFLVSGEGPEVHFWLDDDHTLQRYETGTQVAYRASADEAQSWIEEGGSGGGPEGPEGPGGGGR